MKRILFLQAFGVLILLSAALCFFLGLDIVVWVCLGLLLIFLAVLTALTWRNLKIMDFLVGQARKREPKLPENPPAGAKPDMILFVNQINPHFLYNTLDSIRGQALSCDQHEIALMTEKLSRFFRYCVSSRGDIVKLSEEIKNVQDYFSIQQYRFGERIRLHLELEDSELLKYYIPKLTLQPIVENAISHGIEEYSGKGDVWVKLGATEKDLFIHVIDNGGGMPASQLRRIRERLLGGWADANPDSDKHSGIAVQNVNARIQLCFGSPYGLRYRSMPGEGTDVEIVMPLVDDFSRVSLENRLRNINV
ncbi:MAG: histidine kinase [Oscillospiraceae bacterium]|jgi:two-component system sensor histidine kinase YesM|nr:histidine kinase [Oscillospiraceae bacterium]